MAAVIGPVGIEYADLGHGWISFFFAAEVVLDMQEVFEGHGKAGESYRAFNSASGMSMNPSKILTSAGSSNFVTRVSGFQVLSLWSLPD